MNSNPPVIARLATAIIVVIVVIVGGALALNHDLDYPTYFKSLATGVGLLAVGYGLDSHSRP